jgi:hypothetical protein
MAGVAMLLRRTAGVDARAVHFGASLAGVLRSGFESPGLEAGLADVLNLSPRQLAAVRRSVAAQQAAADELL